MQIGPVTSSSTRFENVIRSNREPGVPWNLIGQPNTFVSTQLETVMFSAIPPPKRNTDHRVLNREFATITFLQLPNSAHASSCERMRQFDTVTYSELMKWNPSLLPFTRLWMNKLSICTCLL